MGGTPPAIYSRQRLINISCFVVWAGSLCIQMILLWWLDFDLDAAINDSLISASVLASFCYLISNTLNHYLPSRKHFVRTAVWVLVLAAISLALSRWLLQFLVLDQAYRDAIDQSLPVRFCFNALTIAWVATINFLWNFQEDIKENHQRKADSERLAREAELHNLRQQLQPHFLFNSLNSIIALITKQPDKARDMTFQLSAFLRGTLGNDDQQFIPLRDELDHLGLYLDIEKVRFGHRLTTAMTVDEIAGAALLPPMILQPLLENAIKFGLYDTTGAVRIEIHAQLREDRLLEIKISNPYEPSGENSRAGTGFGLKGVRRRLFLLFGRTDLLETRLDSSVFISIIRLPQ